MQGRGIILLLMMTLLLSCSPKALREAEKVVAQADSMRAAGQMYADSVRLAQSYTTLRAWRAVHADEYAHACYHYGRLLREKENPVEAMQCFIEASHTRTHDYHILGRVYSNMGSICHLANEFQLSYDMYERSAEMFLHNGDSTAYFYALNDMAFEKAMLTEEDAVHLLIDSMKKCRIADSQLKILEIESELYIRSQRYDSARHKALELITLAPNNTIGILVLAQSYSFTNQKDSAAYYAELLLQKSQNISDIHNALYILTNDDESKSKESIRQIASDRSDIQMRLKDRQSKLSQAVQLLEQDLHRKPDLAWLYAIIATLLFVGSVIGLYIYKKRQKHQLLSQHISALENKTETTIVQMRQQVEERCLVLMRSSSLKKDLQWNDYEALCHFTNQQFYFLADKLQQKGLSKKEIRLCILSLIDCSYDTMADMLFYAPNGVGKFKLRVAKKLGTTAKKMREFLIDMAILG